MTYDLRPMMEIFEFARLRLQKLHFSPALNETVGTDCFSGQFVISPVSRQHSWTFVPDLSILSNRYNFTVCVDYL